ncbi:hypothetical protein KZ483_28175 [Paenibacillus sp. sptzw28]|nr:hypothetical protein [Paenibacillus sp. sptzw28]QYR21490.1 hypothetical protein KZ483_28175 [Paenibacillus sp. sptzw28]
MFFRSSDAFGRLFFFPRPEYRVGTGWLLGIMKGEAVVTPGFDNGK